MKHKPMQTERRWAYVHDGHFEAVVPYWVSKAEATKLACEGENIQRVEVRLVPKGRK